MHLTTLRGGSWDFNAQDRRSTFRSQVSPDFRIDTLGFRVLRPILLSEVRILRGGSWLSIPALTCADYRSNARLYYQNSYHGFRVLRQT